MQSPLWKTIWQFFFSNHVGQALNSVYDKRWKPGILPLECKVTDKQKETLQCPCRGGSGWRHHKLPLTEYVQRWAGIHVYIYIHVLSAEHIELLHVCFKYHSLIKGNRKHLQWPGGKESAYRCREHGFNSCVGDSTRPGATKPLNSSWSLHAPEPKFCKQRKHCNEKPWHSN